MGYQQIINSFKKEVERLSFVLAQPNTVNSFEEYKFRLGVIYGISRALEIVKEQIEIE
jgi:hypothetical protein